ncbi:MAG: hypothetical protein PHN88_01150 [Ignavibacteria bacterium]|nr:hypothetical protein [Ignavibacteria bacterium]
MKKILLALISFVFVLNANAQHDKWNSWNDEWLHIKHPTIELSYGISKTNLDGFSSSFENVSLGDVKLGFSNEKHGNRKSGLSKYVFAYFDFGNVSSDIDARTKTTGKLQSSNWRFGFGRKEGYPIYIGGGSFSILPYTASHLTWTRVDMKQLPDSSNMTDLNRLLLFDKSFRFGNAWEGGINISFTKNFAINAGYERQNTYQRYLFWKNTGSMIIEEAGVGIIDEFVKSVLHREPVAGSIVNFLLKNAYYLGIYQLRSKQMNWPFEGEAALNFDSFKFGITVTF